MLYVQVNKVVCDIIMLTVYAVCGDIADVVNKGRDALQPESDCNVACPGDPTHLCGRFINFLLRNNVLISP